MDAKQIADEARSSIGQYCMEECKAYCCRKGYLELTRKEAALLMNVAEDKVTDTETLKEIEDGCYLLDLGNEKIPCPQLHLSSCRIHTNLNRPECCKDYPLFFEEENNIHVSQRCPAVRAGKLYPFIAELIKLGFVVDD